MHKLLDTMLHRAAAPAAAALLAACASTGGLQPHSTAIDPASLQASRALGDARLDRAGWPAADWWKRFGDPQLDALIDEALGGNPSMGAARARLDRAAALAGAAGAPLTPHVTAAADLNRQRYSATGIFPPPIGGAWYTQSQLALQFSYEIDFWGKNRAAYDAALGQARAAEVDAFAARLLLSAAVARTYAQLGHAFDQLDLARATLDQRQAIFDLTRERLAAGLDTKVELKQAEASIPAARQRIAQIEEEIALARNQLAALAGKGPDRGLSVERPHAQAVPVALPSTLPADLIGRRPDVIAQRWRVEAARRDVDSAKAQFYPNVNLAALVGVQTVSYGKLLSPDSRIPQADAALLLPIFDGGRLRGNLGARDADYDLAVEQYNQTVLDAVREVVDRLASLRSVDTQSTEALAGLSAAEEAYGVAVARYRAGLGNYLQVLAAETQVLDQRNVRADLHYRELDLSIDLIRALGGGFNEASAKQPSGTEKDPS
jgi:NodT family efflux transporter outer membrane factor (OMF) lipoprotein